MTENTTYKNKYLIIWMVTGAVVGVLSTIFLLMSGEIPNASLSQIMMLMISNIISFGMIVFPGFGGLGMLCVASTKGWKFREIEHPRLFWYIYPIFFIFGLPFAIVFVLIVNMIKNTFR
jgi:hypothetical protein